MAASLPSYDEAVSGGHWLNLVAPYVAVQDYPKLCRVSRRFYDLFAPRLWRDPLQTVCRLGLHPNDVLEWFIYFVTERAKLVRFSTRKLVLALDLRVFDTDVPPSIAGTNVQQFSALLRLIGETFPAVRCILLGGNTGYDPSDLGRILRPDDCPDDGSLPIPLVLEVSCCGMSLPNNFFYSSYWRQLVYLDMSSVPGTLKGIIKTGTFHHRALPNLRVLKVCNRELDDDFLGPIAELTRQRLWSLDLGRNKLTDSCIRKVLCPCFGADNLTAQRGRYEVEGKLNVVQGITGAEIPHTWRVWFSYIAESALSASFSHPERYLADSPVYDENSRHVLRLAGSEPLRSDHVESFKKILVGGPGQLPPDWHDAQNADICKPSSSLTHLHLSGNPELTMEGIESVFRFSRGHIRHFDCASPAIATCGQVPFTLAGVLGRSHLFRPVFASNLQSLRIHHSLVTHIPTLSNSRKSALAALEYAETVLRNRAEMAYPRAFVPDLNPRLQSLTLTCLPRVSRGPLIDKLKQVLISAADQEIALWAQQAEIPVSRRGPRMLRGLRHILLEFEPHPPQDENLDGPFESLDAQALLDSSADSFSFFAEEASTGHKDAKRSQIGKGGGRWSNRRSKSFRDSDNGDSVGGNVDARRASEEPKLPGTGGVANAPPPRFSTTHFKPVSVTDVVEQNRAGQRGRLSHYPLPGALDVESEYVRELLFLDDSGNASTAIKVPVWVGSGRQGPSRAVNAYMANLSRESLRTHIRPATPDQVKAGVPMNACIYNAAWDAILWLGEADEDESAAKGNTLNGLPTSAASKEAQSGMASRRPSSQHQSHHSPAMRDVVDAIRQFRAETRASYRPRGLSPTPPTGQKEQQQQPQLASRYWTGTLEVLLAS
ncbi:hypothetical protein SEPCBS57363_003201 [Sporothrix epigloea]|uniref:Leucine rich repeat domain containing protein n=1 Tax=Sporothrix epigloea TaxID=1892477 RepID=A0ABP0DPE4_9PEZI